jgi:hypothetical protein
MPAVRKLTVDEVQTIERKGVSLRKQVEQEYDDLVRQFATGEYAELELGSGETKPQVRSRFNKAVMRAGMDIKWLRGSGDALRFKVVSSPFDLDQVDETDEQEALQASVTADEEVTEEEDFELPELESEPEPVVTKKPARKNAKAVTGRQQFVEAP